MYYLIHAFVDLMYIAQVCKQNASVYICQRILACEMRVHCVIVLTM